MRKPMIMVAALAAVSALAGCNSGTGGAEDTATEASVDDSVNLATDVAPSMAATDVAPSEAPGSTLPATASPRPETGSMVSETPAPK